MASKCHFLEVVSTLNEMEDVGHLRRAACFVLRSICVYVQGLWGETTLNCARFGIFFLSIEGNSLNVYSTVVEFTRRTVFN